MKTDSAQVHRVERVDDIPVLLATLQRLKVAAILDRHFPSGHRWKGTLTFGEVACVWIAFITSHDDRLADMLDHLALDETWQDCEVDLNQHTVRVYHLDPHLFRVDTTTANSYVEVLSELGFFQ